MTTTSRLLLLLLIPLLLVTPILLPKTCAQHHSSSTTWDVLLPLANTISLNTTRYIRRVDDERHFFWNVYRTSSKSQRLPTVVKELNEEVTQWAYINSRVNLVGLFLFGPENYRSILSTVRSPNQDFADDMQCFASTWHMFYEHCGCLPKHCYERLTAFGNMCNYATDKAAIKDALSFACGMDRINPLTVNMKNRPSILRVTPAPVRGSFKYCDRVAIEGLSRMKLGSFFKKYHVLLLPSGTEWNDKEAQVCVHRDASLGLCECEKNDWKSLGNKEWSFVMSPYKQLYVDVKLSPGTHGFVSVYLEEVLQEWRYVLLAIGLSLLFLAPVASKCFPSSITARMSITARILAVRAIALICIFESSMDTLFATVAVVTCLTVYILISFINQPVTREKRKLKQLRGQDLTKVRAAEFPSRGKKKTGRGKKKTEVEAIERSRSNKRTLIASENGNGNGNGSESVW